MDFKEFSQSAAPAILGLTQDQVDRLRVIRGVINLFLGASEHRSLVRIEALALPGGRLKKSVETILGDDFCVEIIEFSLSMGEFGRIIIEAKSNRTLSEIRELKASF